MRDSYVADVGDFGKYALLNALAGDDLRLGVLWCRNILEETSSDGRFTQYDELKACDPTLHGKLLKLLKGNHRTMVPLMFRLPLESIVNTVVELLPEMPCSRSPWPD
jgi:hypothetical protein